MGSSCRCYARAVISIILALVCCLTPALAADGGNSVYSISADTKAVTADRSTGNWTAFDYGYISSGAYSTHAITNNEDFWQYTNHSLARGLADLYNRADLILSADNSINSKLTTTNGSLNTINSSIGSLLSKTWGSLSSNITVWRMDTDWSGNFSSQSVSTLADAIALDSINNMYSAYWAKLNNDALWSVQGQVAALNSTTSSASSIAHTDSTNLGNKVVDSTRPTGNSAYYHTQTLQYESVAYPSYLITTTNGYRVATGGDMGTVTSLGDYLDLLSRDLIVQGNMLFNFSRTYTQDRYNLSSHSSSSSTIRSLADSLTYGFSDLSNFTGRLASVFASDDDIQAREDADPQIQQAQQDFVSPDGAASVKLGDMGSAKDVSAQMQQSLNTGVSPSTAFSFFGTGGGLFALFTQDIKDDMDAVPQTRGGEDFVDFYSHNLEMIGVPFDDSRK